MQNRHVHQANDTRHTPHSKHTDTVAAVDLPMVCYFTLHQLSAIMRAFISHARIQWLLSKMRLRCHSIFCHLFPIFTTHNVHAPYTLKVSIRILTRAIHRTPERVFHIRQNTAACARGSAGGSAVFGRIVTGSHFIAASFPSHACVCMCVCQHLNHAM